MPSGSKDVITTLGIFLMLFAVIDFLGILLGLLSGALSVRVMGWKADLDRKTDPGAYWRFMRWAAVAGVAAALLSALIVVAHQPR